MRSDATVNELQVGDVCESEPSKGDSGRVTLVRLGTAADFLNAGNWYVTFEGAAKRCVFVLAHSLY